MNKIEVLRTSQCFEEYEPVTLGGTDFEPRFPGKTVTQSFYKKDISDFADETINKKLATLLSKSNSSDCKILNKIGIAYAKYNKYEQAEEYFQKAIDINPEFISSHINLGNLYLLQKKPDIALSNFLTALSKSAHSAPLYIKIAKTYFLKQDFIKANDMYLKAIDINPDLKNEYSYLSKENDSGTRANDDVLRKIKQIVWEDSH